MKIYGVRKILAIILAISFTNAYAQPICTPNMTPEQAFLSLKNPSQSPASPNISISNPTTLPNTIPKLINLNTATEAELTQLDGIGAKKAQDIILYREMIAPFASVDDLDKVKGIGKATVDKNRNRLTVQ